MENGKEIAVGLNGQAEVIGGTDEEGLVMEGLVDDAGNEAGTVLVAETTGDNAGETAGEVTIKVTAEEEAVVSEQKLPKETIIGFDAFRERFYGQIPMPGVPRDVTVLDKNGGEEIRPIADAVVLKIDGEYLLLTRAGASNLQESCKATGIRYERMLLATALGQYETAKKAAEAEAARVAELKKAYGSMKLGRFGEDGFWKHMNSFTGMRIADFKPTVGDAPAENLKLCAERSAEFEVAYMEALSNAAPKTPSEYFAWEKEFTSERMQSGAGVPHTKGLRLLTRSFGKFGQYGAIVRTADAELVVELAKVNKNRDGETYEVRIFNSDLYLAVLRWKFFFAKFEEERTAAMVAEEEAKRNKGFGTIGEYLGQEKADQLRRGIYADDGGSAGFGGKGGGRGRRDEWRSGGKSKDRRHGDRG